MVMHKKSTTRQAQGHLVAASGHDVAMSAFHDSPRARVFGTVAGDYDRWRPGYPVDAVDWMLPAGATAVADVGAGTGKLTRLLVGRGLAVMAIEPDAAMLELLSTNCPDVIAIRAPAEQLPLDDASVDAVLVGQAWHWFDHHRAVAEVRRVLRPGGCLSLIGNGPSAGAAWQRELEALSPDAAGGTQSDHHDDENPWADYGLTGMPYELRRFAWREQITPGALRARLATHSMYVVMPEDERRRSLDRLAAVALAEADRTGEDQVWFDHTAFCVRVQV